MNTATRVEHDSFGTIEVPADRMWGATTQRSLRHFHISTERMPASLLLALALMLGEVTAAQFDEWVRPESMV